MGFFTFLKGVLSEDGVTGSYSRCASAFVVFFTVMWITFLVFKHGVMPDLTEPLAFISAVVGVHMGINKAAEIVSATKGTPIASNTPTGSTPIPPNPVQ